MIKFIATDMDGTLLNSKKELSPEFYDVFEELKKRASESAAADREITPEEKRAFAEKHLKTLVKLRDPEVGELEKNHLLKEFVKEATYHKADNSLSVIYMMVAL